MNLPDYIDAVQNDQVIVKSKELDKIQFLIELGFKKKWFSVDEFYMKYRSEKDLAGIFSLLNTKGFIFASDSNGWPPAAIFEYLREKGLVKGSIKKILWKGRGDFEIFEEND